MMLFLSLLFVLLFFVLTRLVFLMIFKNSKLNSINLVQDEHLTIMEQNIHVFVHLIIQSIKKITWFFFKFLL